MAEMMALEGLVLQQAFGANPSRGPVDDGRHGYFFQSLSHQFAGTADPSGVRPMRLRISEMFHPVSDASRVASSPRRCWIALREAAAAAHESPPVHGCRST